MPNISKYLIYNDLNFILKIIISNLSQFDTKICLRLVQLITFLLKYNRVSNDLDRMQKFQGKILVIDDDKDVLITSRMILKQYFTDVITLENPYQLEEEDLIRKADVIILDMNFKPGDTSCEEGIIWLKKILKNNPAAHVLMNTAYGDIEVAVKAMKLGAIDFLVKPWTKEKLLASVMTTYRLSRAHKQVKNLKYRQQVLINDLNRDYSDLIAH
ncbi:MAG: hypothetical protein AMS27_10155, partial [Bacteroides sp. SM23_62_1]